MRTCNHCSRTLELSNFSKDVKGKEGYRQKCRECSSVYAVKVRYGEDGLLLLNKSTCDICGVSLTKGNKGRDRRNIDHDHKTGSVNLILCHRCNTALGLLGENIQTIENMAEYLRKAASKEI